MVDEKLLNWREGGVGGGDGRYALCEREKRIRRGDGEKGNVKGERGWRGGVGDGRMGG